MSHRVCKFSGSFPQLCALVTAAALPGVWEKMPTGYVRFVCHTGALLNWWPSTGSVNFQGPRDAASQFEQALLIAVEQLPRSARQLTDQRIL